MGTIRILDSTGDTMVSWTLEDPSSLLVAGEVFDRLTAERRLAFAREVGAPASEAELIKTFDPSADEIVFVRPVAGG